MGQLYVVNSVKTTNTAHPDSAADEKGIEMYSMSVCRSGKNIALTPCMLCNKTASDKECLCSVRLCGNVGCPRSEETVENVCARLAELFDGKASRAEAV